MQLRSIGPHREDGQALPLILVFLIVLSIGVLFTFNTSQVVTKKVELTNTADAAAFSIAAEQARAWNMAAYMNRGRVANEVAIAQIVSINSWLTQLNVTAQNIEDLARVIGIFFPPIQAAAQAINAAETVFRQFRNSVLRPASNLAIIGLDTADTLYAEVAEQLVENAATVNAIAVARSVVTDNSPQAELSVKATAVLGLQLERSQDAYLQEYRAPRSGASAGHDRYRNVVMESRDRFTRDRRDNWIVVDANGGTDMVEYDRWSAVDINEVDISLGLDAINIPVGWGGAQAVNGRQPRFFPGMNNGRGWQSPYDNRRHRAYNGVTNRSIAGKIIDRNNGWPRTGGNKRDAYFTGYRNGIKLDYYDVKRDMAKTSIGNKAGPVYTVEVQTGIQNVRTSTQVGVGAGRLALRDEARSNRMRAMSSAQVYFNRPFDYAPFRRRVWGRNDGRFEMGSLFSPYWQARLVETPADIRSTLALTP